MKTQILGLKELRKNMEKYALQVQKGKSFIVVKKSKPIFKISAPDDEEELWETVADFSKFKGGGIPIDDLLARL